MLSLQHQKKQFLHHYIQYAADAALYIILLINAIEIINTHRDFNLIRILCRNLLYP